ncbi:BnaC02g33130D [Brassica napus]|uniref:F-box domain-containing protein n=2 Tax=Brassica TaxID=3705 RepID=A0A3P6DGJ1_BRAOL|nr:unnamed protein product [Brassica napus]CDY40579.1 BnaC02g33130D [Brassica napus]VDD25458.1 unnamed protein product [Brassica oleracea]
MSNFNLASLPPSMLHKILSKVATNHLRDFGSARIAFSGFNQIGREDYFYRSADLFNLNDWIEEANALRTLMLRCVAVPTTEVPIIRKGPTTRSGSRVIRAGFAKAVQELLAQEQTGFKQLLIQELADLKLEDTSKPLEVPDSFHSSQFSSIDQNEAGLTISTFILNPSNQLSSKGAAESYQASTTKLVAILHLHSIHRFALRVIHIQQAKSHSYPPPSTVLYESQPATRCYEAGNLEAIYIRGMYEFFVLHLLDEGREKIRLAGFVHNYPSFSREFVDRMNYMIMTSVFSGYWGYEKPQVFMSLLERIDPNVSHDCWCSAVIEPVFVVSLDGSRTRWTCDCCFWQCAAWDFCNDIHLTAANWPIED